MNGKGKRSEQADFTGKGYRKKEAGLTGKDTERNNKRKIYFTSPAEKKKTERSDKQEFEDFRTEC
jgi:hypothetical protein